MTTDCTPHQVHSWHGSSGADRLLCSDEDTFDREEWALHFTCTQATRSAAVHVELFGTPIGGAPYACTVLPGTTLPSKTTVSYSSVLMNADDR